MLTVAEVAGVMAAKRTADLVPHRVSPLITKAGAYILEIIFPSPNLMSREKIKFLERWENRYRERKRKDVGKWKFMG